MKKPFIFLYATLFLAMSGLQAQTFGGGTGNALTPYLITTPAHLEELATQVNGGNEYAGSHFSLTADLDLSAYANWTPIGITAVNAFKGNFYGGGHSIANLTVNSSADNLGLFGYLSGAAVEGLYLTGAAVAASGTYNCVGILAGYADASSSLTACYVAGSVSGQYNIGALVGYLTASSVSGCYAAAAVSGTNSVGGLVGRADGSTIIGSYASGNAAASNIYAGGLAGALDAATVVSYCYATGNASATTGYAAGLVGRVYDAASTVSNSVAAGAAVTAPNYTGRIVGGNSNNAVFTNNYASAAMTVNGTAVTGGTAADLNGAPKTDDELKSLVFYNSAANWATAAWSIAAAYDQAAATTWNIWQVGGSRPYLQTQSAPAAITAAGLTTLSGTYRSDEHTTDSIRVYHNGVYAATLDASALNAGAWTYSFASPLAFGDTLSAVVYQSRGGKALMPSYPVDAKAAFCGGDGLTAATAYEICNAATLAALAARVNAGNGYAGTHFRLTADLDLSAYSNWMRIGILNSPFRGNFHGGGHSIANLTINGSADYIGLFGYTDGAAIDSLSLTEVNVQGSGYVGALGGYITNSQITSCYAAGSVIGSTFSFYIGGLVGGMYSGQITSCHADVSAIGYSYIGGLTGTGNNSQITGSYATGNVTAISQNGESIGGLAGYATYGNQITSCYAAGSVSGTADFAGGLVGEFYSTGSNAGVQNSVAANPAVTGSAAYIHRVFGYISGSNYTVSNNYAYDEMLVNGSRVFIDDTNNGTGKSLSALQQAGTYVQALSWSLQSSYNTAKTWNIWESKSLPYMQTQSAPAVIATAADGSLSGSYRNDEHSTDSIRVYVNGVYAGSQLISGTGGTWAYSFTGTAPTDGDTISVVLYQKTAGGKALWPSYRVSKTYRLTSTGIDNDAADDRALSLYPNPVSDVLHISGVDETSAPSVRIYSLNGVLVLQSTGSSVGVSALAPGMYIVDVDGVKRSIVKR